MVLDQMDIHMSKKKKKVLTLHIKSILGDFHI